MAPKPKHQGRRSPRRHGQSRSAQPDQGRFWIWGRAVVMALSAKRAQVHEIRVIDKAAFGRLQKEYPKIPRTMNVREGDPPRGLEDARHMGLFADVELKWTNGFSKSEGERRRGWVFLDKIQDAHNLGTIARTTKFYGFQGLVFPKDGSVDINGRVVASSAGAILQLDLMPVVNLVRAMKTLQDAGGWVLGLDPHAEASMRSTQCSLDPSWSIVVGNEGDGMRRLVRDACDQVLRLSDKSGFESLNASIAASIAMHHLVEMHPTPRTH